MATVFNKDKVIYPELSYKLTGVCFKVQDELGRFAKEKQYCERLEAKFVDFLLRVLNPRLQATL